MTEFDVNAGADRGAPLNPASAGALLRAAREASGMAVDAVAQQLKLAPRQVRALEESDFTHLPGRTFVRGFIRNYARLVQLDADAVLSALPDGTSTPNLESPALHATAPTMGELPTTEAQRHGWTRWAIPLTLIAIIAATAAWELIHPAAEVPRSVAKKATPLPQPENTGAPEVIDTPLRNPVATSSAPPVVPPETDPAPVSVPIPMVLAPKAAPEPVAAPADPAPEGRPSAADAPLMLGFRDFSWTEVKDRSGRVLLSRMNRGGTTQAIAGAPPLEVVIGNAADVTVSWKGKPVDLAPHTRQNVARLTLD